ncbi:MAG: hypothetical protein AAF481_18850 [Acidobacteriota bacterium]
MIRRERRRAALGIFLLSVYLVQAILGWEWSWLAGKQLDESFKRWTGCLLLAYLLHQWWLTVGRAMGWARAAKKSYRLHKNLGLVAPVFFYFHSMRLGYGYLLLLSSVYLGNLLVGYLHPVSIGFKPKMLSFPWMVVHVALAVLTMLVVAYHTWFVLYYE